MSQSQFFMTFAVIAVLLVVALVVLVIKHTQYRKLESITMEIIHETSGYQLKVTALQHHLNELNEVLDEGADLLKEAEAHINEVNLNKSTMQARIDELVTEVELLEERTHSTIDAQLRGKVHAISVLEALMQEARSECYKLGDKLFKANRQNVSTQRVVAEQEAIIEELRKQVDEADRRAVRFEQRAAGAEKELAENRHAADFEDNIMDVVDATREI